MEQMSTAADVGEAQSDAVGNVTEGAASDTTFDDGNDVNAGNDGIDGNDGNAGNGANQQAAGDQDGGKTKGNGGEDTAAEAIKAANARAAEARRERERAAAQQGAKAQARLEVVLAMTGGENPYTHEQIRDERDVQEYLTMLDIDKRGGDPIRDYNKIFKQQMRDQEVEAQKQEAQRQWYLSDHAAFKAAYPDVDLEALKKDPDFLDYADGKVGRVPLHQIYHGYKSMMDKITAGVEKKVTRAVAQQQAARQATPGSLSGSGEGDVFFTREAVQKMSQKEVHENYDQIMRDMKHWK